VPRGGTFDQVATLRPFRLPGGDRAVREPRRTAFALLHAIYGDGVLARTDLAPVAALRLPQRRLLADMIGGAVNSPMTTSMGRLFDAVAALCGLCQETTFEGQAAMALEFAVDESATGRYSMAIVETGAAGGAPSRLVLDWRPVIESLLDDLRLGVAIGTIAFRFHDGLASAIGAVATRVGLPRVVLTGGCFQNRLLLERAIQRLGDAGFRAYWHQRVPPNDGGIALGQAAVAARMERSPAGGRQPDGGE